MKVVGYSDPLSVAPGDNISFMVSCENDTYTADIVKLRRGGKHPDDPDFKELLDTRGRWDLASPLGEWTKIEAICVGARIAIKVNGVTVNETYDVFPAGGRILFQNEGHEVFFRNAILQPAKK